MFGQNAQNLSGQQDLIKRWLGSGSLNVFGRPFAGKDTQCSRLAEWLGGPVIGGGDIIRSTQDVPPEVRSDEEAGILVPQDSYLAIVTPYLSQQQFDRLPLILSSVGRWHGEEYEIIKAAQTAGHPIKCAIYIELDDQHVEERFQLAHADESRTIRADHHTLDTRLDEFKNKTMPVLDTYRQQGLLETVDGVGDVNEIERRIIEALYKRANRGSR